MIQHCFISILAPNPVCIAPQTVSGSEAPPLRIHHLMIWMVVTAALITIGLIFDRTLRNGPPLPFWSVIRNMLTAIAVAGSLTGWATGRRWRADGISFPKEPGEQLLTLIAVGTLGFAAVVIGSLAVFFASFDDAFVVVFLAG